MKNKTFALLLAVTLIFTNFNIIFAQPESNYFSGNEAREGFSTTTPQAVQANNIPIAQYSAQVATTFAELRTHLNNASVTSIEISGTLNGAAETNQNLVVNRAVTLTGTGTVQFAANQFGANSGRIEIAANGHLTVDGPTIGRAGALSNMSVGVQLNTGTSQFTLVNGAVRGHHVGIAIVAGQVHLNGGIVESNRETGVNTSGNNATLNMNNNAIIRNNGLAAATNRRGGVFMSGGLFNMNGGEIINNTGNAGHAGGVTVVGTFNMQGGRIANNTAPEGAGIRISNANAANMTIASAAVFTGNNATNGLNRRDDLVGIFPNINPGTVTVAAAGHPFTGHDIFVIGAPLPAPTVTSVTVSPSAYSLYPGEIQTFSATVVGTNNPPQTVVWSVSGATSASTVIDAGGILTIGADETATSITVIATSTVDGTSHGTATVTVQHVVSSTTPSLRVTTATANTTGVLVDVPIILSNNPGVMGFEFSVAYNANHLELVSYTVGSVINLPVEPPNITANPIRFNFEEMGMANNTNDGTILTLRFYVKDTLALGEFTPITTQIHTAMNMSFENISFASINGGITMSSVIFGDVDGDGIITFADVLLLRQYLAGWSGITICPIASDTNGDGIINVLDVLRLRQYRAGFPVTMGPVIAPFSGVTPLFAVGNVGLFVDNYSAQRGEYIDIEINLQENPGLWGLAFTLDYNNAILTPISITAPLAPLGLPVPPQVDGVLRFSYESSNFANTVNTGTIATIRFKANDNAAIGTSAIALTNIDAFNVDEERFSIANITTNVTISGTNNETETTPDNGITDDDSDADNTTKPDDDEKPNQPPPEEDANLDNNNDENNQQQPSSPGFGTSSPQETPSQTTPTIRNVPTPTQVATTAEPTTNITVSSDNTHIYSANIITELANSGYDLTITHDGVSVTFDVNTLERIAADAEEIEFLITPVSDATINSLKSEMEAAGRYTENLIRIAEIKVMADGQPITNFNGLITISFDLSGHEIFPNISGFRLNEGYTYSFFGGELNGYIFSFKTDRLSTYGIMANVNLTSLRFAIGSSAFTQNGITKENDVSPFIENNRTLVPLRAIAEGLGAIVSWNGEQQTANLKLNNNNISLTIGETGPGLDIPPRIVNNRTFVPMRYVSEMLGANVVWDGFGVVYIFKE